MAFCSGCGVQVPEGSTLCLACTAKASSATVQRQTSSGLTDNIAGLLCYSPVGLIADIVFLVAEPYNRNRFIRFHAFQSLFTGVAVIGLAIVLGLIGMALAMIPIVGWIIDFLLWSAFVLGNLILWVIMMIKAYQMQSPRLPVIGDMAEKQASASA